MTFISITWHTMGDDRVCPICRNLEGYTWSYEPITHELSDLLIHPQMGVVWSVTEGSRAHGHRGNCRCHITYVVDVSTLLNKAIAIRDQLLQLVPEAAMTPIGEPPMPEG
jgi:hypothetical protein